MPVDQYRQHLGFGVEGYIDEQRFSLGNERLHQQAQMTGNSEASNTAATDKRSHSIPKSVILYQNETPLARFELLAPLRSDAIATVKKLIGSGLKLVILSGDSHSEVSRVASALGIPTYLAEQSPEQKLQYINRLQKEGRKVTVVGDGMNDIPVLAAASTSIAVANATDLAKTKADCFLLNPGISIIAESIVFSQRVKSIIRQNIGWAITYNAIAMPCAAIGLIQPWLAAIGMSVSSLVVVLNALRLSRFSSD